MLNKFVKQLGGDEIILWEGAYSPLFTMFRWNNQDNYNHTYKTPASPMFEVIEGRNAMLLFNGTRYASYAREIFIKYWNEPVAFSEQFNKCKTVSAKITDMYNDYILRDLVSMDEKVLVKGLSEIHNLLAELLANSIFIELFDKSSIINTVAGIDQSILDGIWEKATHPAFESFEIRRLAYIVNEFKNRPTQYSKTCRFIYTDYFDSKSEDEVAASLAEITEEKQLIINENRISESAVELVGKADDFENWLLVRTPIEAKLARYIQLVMDARDWRKDPIAQAQTLLFVFGQELLRRVGVADKYVPYVLSHEYEQGTEALKMLSADMTNRPKGTVAFADVSSEYQIMSSSIDDIKKEILHIAVGHEKITSLRGQVGASGKATGTVKVVKNMSESHKFEQGDILVTGMTRPEFVPLMKMASAIVTNEGGITCHAAIVARELHKPCIIGTKVATQVLKDGDIVEVDADKGIVNILG